MVLSGSLVAACFRSVIAHFDMCKSAAIWAIEAPSFNIVNAASSLSFKMYYVPLCAVCIKLLDFENGIKVQIIQKNICVNMGSSLHRSSVVSR